MRTCLTKQQLDSMSYYEYDEDEDEVANASFYGTTVQLDQYKPESNEKEMVMRLQGRAREREERRS